jgi:phosphate/phosphite/phosphonate ABC transporter binding protein
MKRSSGGGETALRFGTYLAPNMLRVYQAIADHVGARLGLRTELVVETDYESCARDVNDVCFVCSLPYVQFERQGISPAVPVAAPVLTGQRYGGRPVYFSDVIVQADSRFRSFLDLRGRSWAYNEPLSHSGYGVTRYHLVELGETRGFFGDVIEAGFHEESIRMVANREVDASAIDSQVLAIALRDDPSLAGSLRVIESLGPSTIQPVAVARRLSPGLREAVRSALTSMHEDAGLRATLALGFVERFVAVGPEDYDDIRMMLTACEEAGFMELR